MRWEGKFPRIVCFSAMKKKAKASDSVVILRLSFYIPLALFFAFQLWLAVDKLSDGRPGTLISYVDNKKIRQRGK